MDRLQLAITEARARREAVLSGQPGGATLVPFRSRAASATASAWEAIPAMEVDDATLAANRIVTRRAGADAAPIDVLRTRVMQQMRPNGWSRLAVTSPEPACGKSTVVTNLAFSLARLDGPRVMVVDLDLRRPSQARLLGFDGGHCVGRLLRGQAALERSLVRVAPTLAFATNARPVRASAELLQGDRIGTLLDAVARDYAPDVILFDLPPLMASDDALAFLPRVDCALLVAAAEQSSLSQVDVCEKEIAAQTAMLGVVLNKCAHPGASYGYGYDYGDG